MYSLDGYDVVGSDAEIAQNEGVQAINSREVDALVPEELHQFELAEDAGDFSRGTAHQNTMDATAKHLDGLVKSFIEWQGDERLLPANRLNVPNRNGVSFGGFAGNFIVQGNLVFVRSGAADNDEKVGIEVVEVKGRDGGLRGTRFADEDDV